MNEESVRLVNARGRAGPALERRRGAHVITMTRWPFDPASITAPFDLWYGEQDTSTVHSPDRGAFLARRIPASRRHVLPDAGGSLLWTHAGDVLAPLVRALGR